MEKLKIGLQVFLLGGMGFLVFRLKQTDTYLEKAKAEIFAAQAKIDSAQNLISNVKLNLNQLDTQSVATQSQLAQLRREREALNKLYKALISKQQDEIKRYRAKVDSLRTSRQKLMEQLETMEH
jgi:chromosome segregation ATPase